MSAKPEKIWLNTDTSFKNGCYIDTQISKVEMANRVEYIRADLAKPSEWISVDDRLPEDSGYYMVGHPDGLVTMLPWNPIDGWHNASLDDEGYWNQRITHYQPLPTPPTRETP